MTVKVCKRGHSYAEHLRDCPFCGSADWPSSKTILNLPVPKPEVPRDA
jgi:RNA polymerase subunit RPABC4/transcription elongation factor Spt4